MIKQLCALLALLWSVNSAQSQELKEWRFWDASDGFEESLSSGIALDPSGNVYVNHGIVKNMSVLDGYTVRQIPSPSVHVVIRFDPQGQLWGFNSPFFSNKLEGFKKYNEKQGEWIDYPFVDGQTYRFGPLAYRFEAPVQDRLIFSLPPDRVMEYNTGARAVSTIVTVTETSLLEFSRDVCLSQNHSVWIPGLRGALKVFPQGEGEHLLWKFHAYPLPKGFQSLTKLVEDPQGRLYGSVLQESTQKKVLMCLAAGSWEMIYSMDSDIHLGWRDSQHQIWVSSNSLYQITPNKIKSFEQGIFSLDSGNQVLLGDNDVFWMTTAQGLARHAPTAWRTPVELQRFNGTYPMIAESPPGCLWFATTFHMVRYRDGKATVFPFPKDTGSGTVYPKNMLTLPDGKVAIGGGRGILLFDPLQECFKINIYPERWINLIFPRDCQSIWVDTMDLNHNNHHVLEKYDWKNFQAVMELSGFLKIPGVSDILETPEGDLWIGHIDQQGPLLFQNHQWRSFGPSDGYNDSGAFAFLDRGQGRIWVGGRKAVWEYDGQHWTILRSGMDTVRAMIQGRDGSIWVASCSGLHQYRDGNWITYTSEDGLPNTEVSGVYEDSQGRIWAGTVHGVALYYPDTDRDSPDTYIAGKDNVNRIAPGGEAHLVFTGRDKWKYTETSRLLYSYRLDGQEWSSFSTDTIAAYKGLSAGPHCFEVRAMDRNWNVDPTPAAFSFTVLLPWYRQPSFLLTSFLGTLLLLSVFYYAFSRHLHLERLVTRRTQALQAAHDELLVQQTSLRALAGEMALVEERERRRIAEDLHDRIGHGLAACQMQIETLQMKMLNGKVDEMVERTKNLILEVIEDTRTLTFEISPSVLYELGLEAAVEWLARSVEDQHGLKVDIVDDGQPKKLEPDTRGAVYRAVRELLFNICKHAGTNEAVVTLSRENGFVCVEVSDNGRGFDVNSVQGKSAPERGFGLFSIRERMEHLAGKFECVSKPDQGTRITIMVPVDHHDESYLS